MQNERYSLEKAQEEAEILRRKVKSGEASDYAEADSQLDNPDAIETISENKPTPEEIARAKYLDLTWRRYSDEEIRILSKQVKVNIQARTNINVFFAAKGYPEVVKQSGTDRLIDLGSSKTILMSPGPGEDLIKNGIREYIGIDLGVKDTEFKTYTYKDPKKPENEPEQSIQVKFLQKEILEALHSFPDNYANITILGIEARLVIKNFHLWSLALLSEMKRVVPQNGFIFTDDGFLKDIIEGLAPEFRKARIAVGPLDDYRTLSASEFDDLKKSREPYMCPEDDPFKLGTYVVDAPEIGYRIYFDKIGSWEKFVLVNTNKTKLD